MKTLGIETSCDETAIAVYDSEHGIIGESVYSQIKMHAEYGGVVPELASRDHCVKIISVLKEAIGDLDLKTIDQIAYTSGPGLLGALLIGESFAQGLSIALNIPLEHCEESTTLFYSLTDESQDDVYYPTYNCGGHSHSNAVEVERFNLVQPAVLRVDVPHGVYNPCKEPRTVATFRFESDLQDLL